jgi:tight adherence protein C
MSILLYILVGLVIFACAGAVVALQMGRERRAILGRVDGRSDDGPQLTILRRPEESAFGRLAEWLKANTPETWSDAGEATGVLVHAGFDSPEAPLFYTTIRLAAAVLLPLAALTISAGSDMLKLVLLVGAALFIGVIGPRAVVDNLASKRRDRIRKAVPDTLDLMVVCVEAGVGLDAAMLRVARDMASLHPDLASEFLIVNRKMSAGLTRADALQGLYARTGLEELRGLASSMIQSERLGSSIARVLRVYSETIRRKRKQAAEQRAAKAALKMLFPMALFMLPALFAIVLGPAAFTLADALKAVGK